MVRVNWNLSQLCGQRSGKFVKGTSVTKYFISLQKFDHQTDYDDDNLTDLVSRRIVINVKFQFNK